MRVLVVLVARHEVVELEGEVCKGHAKGERGGQRQPVVARQAQLRARQRAPVNLDSVAPANLEEVEKRTKKEIESGQSHT